MIQTPKLMIQPVLPNMKFVMIDGVKAGVLHKASRRGPNTLMGPGRLECDWTGEFAFRGETLRVGPTQHVKALGPKCERLMRGVLVRAGEIEAAA